jgi:hypothetical protein
MSRELRTRARTRIQPESDDESDDSDESDTPAQLPPSSIQDLVNPADAQDFDQTFTDADANLNIEGAFDPVAGDKQVIPRIAYVLNFNLVYNESEERWEPDTGFSNGVGEALNSRGVQTSAQSIPDTTPTRLSLDAARTDSAGTVDTGSNVITVEEDGVYVVGAAVEYDSPPDGDVTVADIRIDGNAVAKDQSPTVGGGSNISVYPVVTTEITAPADITCNTRQFTGSTEQTTGGSEANQLYVARLGTIPS